MFPCSSKPLGDPHQYLIYPEIFARTMAAILDCPEIFAGRTQEPQNARIPHLLGTQRAANKVINPHQSPTYPGVGGGGGVGVYFDWCIIIPSKNVSPSFHEKKRTFFLVKRKFNFLKVFRASGCLSVAYKFFACGKSTQNAKVQANLL